MKFLSLCSGIEAASAAWHPLGFECVGVAEIEAFPSAVLAYRYPQVPNYGDISEFLRWPERVFEEADIIVGGPPCQSFSIAGLRKGLDDERGNLTLTYARIIDHADRLRLRSGKPPVICVYENVPGIFSDKTNAFGNLIGGLSGEDVPLEPPGGKWTHCGAVLGPQRAIAWRVQDAQYHGLAQRRQRVFVVASAREGFDPSQVLLEWEGVRRDTPPSRQARKDPAAALGVGVEERRGERGRDDGRGRDAGRPERGMRADVVPEITHEIIGTLNHSAGHAGLYIPLPETEVVGCLSDGAHNGGGLNGQDAYTGRILATVAPSLSIGFSVKDYGADAQENIAPTLRAMNHTDSHANGGGQLGVVAPPQGSFPWPQEVADPLTSNEAKTYTHEGTTFRTRNVVPHDFDGVAEPSPEPQGFYTTDGRFNGIPPAGLSPPLKVGTGTGGTGNTGAAYLASDALAFNGYQRTVSRVASPITASDYKKVEIGVLTFVDEDADEPPAYCYPDADQLGYAPGDEAPETPSPSSPTSTQREAVALSFNQRDEPRFSPVAYSLQTQPGSDEQLVMEFASSVPAYAVALRGREGGNTAELGGEIQPALRTGGGGSDKPHVLVAASQDPFVFDTTQVTHPENRCQPKPGDPSHPLAAAGHAPTLAASAGGRMVVRRLTPRECERLQGFPDDWTLIPWKNKPAVDCPDGPRYKALGNSMAVPCMRWIGRRIDAHVKGTSP